MLEIKGAKCLKKSILQTLLLEICLKMDVLLAYTPKFRPEIFSITVAERSKASDHFRSFGQKLRWGPGKIFFLLFLLLYLTLVFFFTPFFKPYVTFPQIYMATFLKMAPLFSYVPTVP